MGALERAIEIVGSQEKLGEGVGVTQGRVAQWLSGEPIANKYFSGISRLTGGEVTEHQLLDDELRKHRTRVRARKSA